MMSDIAFDEKTIARLEAVHERRLSENKLAYYKPYPKQMDFHAAGASFRERLMLAANQSGKTWAGGNEAALHATGKYPDWWKGYRFDRPNVGWASGETNEVVRDTIQRIMIGRTGSHGTGTIPKADIVDLIPARGIAEAMDIIRVRHVSGGISTISLKSYSAGREKFQGETIDWNWWDEEPPEDIYTEALTRTNVSGGPNWMTFTPLKGVSEVVRRFLHETSASRHVTSMTIEDAEHIPSARRQEIIDSYPAHEREARTKGIPILGSGRIFPITEDSLYCEQREFPDHWPRIGGMDFGWTHSFAAVEVVWDRENDTVYVNRAHRMAEATPIVHAAAIRPWGKLKWSWPRDGRRDTLEGAGKALADQFAEQGLEMLPIHAQFEDKSVSVEASLFKMLTMMQTGRFKVMRHLNDWFEEFRLYHRKDGKVVKERDDLLSATRYAVMMLRYATCVKDNRILKPGGRPPLTGRGQSTWMSW